MGKDGHRILVLRAFLDVGGDEGWIRLETDLGGFRGNGGR